MKSGRKKPFRSWPISRSEEHTSELQSRLQLVCRLPLEKKIHHIQQHPTLSRILKGRLRRYLPQRFPYGVIYAVDEDVIYIAAIMHLKRKPGYWVSRGKS